MRRVFRSGLAIICLLMLCTVALAAPQRRTALVIGNAAYGEIGVLRNPVNDASDKDISEQAHVFARARFTPSSTPYRPVYGHPHLPLSALINGSFRNQKMHFPIR